MYLVNLIPNIRSNTKISIINYLSGEIYIEDVARNVYENKEKWQRYHELKHREVHAVEVENDTLNIEIV